MARQSPKSIRVNPNARCLRVYPVEDTTRSVKELKTVGLKLSKDQAVHLARILLAVSQDWDEVDITAYRFKKRRSDGTHQLTVTSFRD